MRRKSILSYIREMGKPVFTTREISVLSARSVSAVTQALNSLAKDGVIVKMHRGIWAEKNSAAISPYAIVPYLFPRNRAYISFVSALHIHGIVEQIPQITTLASTVHSRTIRTKSGVFEVHRVAPSFFDGFGWYNGGGGFLIAEPEKAFVDCLYLSAHKKKYFGHFPELCFPAEFSIKKVNFWVNRISSSNTRTYVKKQLDRLHGTIF